MRTCRVLSFIHEPTDSRFKVNTPGPDAASALDPDAKLPQLQRNLMAPPRKIKSESAWIRVVPISDLYGETILRILRPQDATALNEGETKYFLSKLRKNPEGYTYAAVATATIKAAGQYYLIRATKQR